MFPLAGHFNSKGSLGCYAMFWEMVPQDYSVIGRLNSMYCILFLLLVMEWNGPAKEIMWENQMECGPDESPMPMEDAWDEAKLQSQAQEKSPNFLIPFARDGYIPNSVIRGDGHARQPTPKVSETKLKRKQVFAREFTENPKPVLDISHILSTAKSLRGVQVLQPEVDLKGQAKEDQEVDETEELARLEMMVQSILDTLDEAEKESYSESSSILYELVFSNCLSIHRKKIKDFFLNHAKEHMPIWKQLAAWRNLFVMKLFSEGDYSLLVYPLIHDDHEIRNLACTILDQEFNIRDKTTLKNKLRHKIP